MALARFKLKKADASTQLATFDKQPSWRDLVTEITLLFAIPPDDVIVSYIDKDKETITLHNEEELQRFYMSLDPSCGSIKFVVQDIKVPDSERVIFIQLTAHSHLLYLTLTTFRASRCIGSSLLNQRQSLQLGRSDCGLSGKQSTW